MSRHKIIQNLDLDEELDDYDGGEEYAYDGMGYENENADGWGEAAPLGELGSWADEKFMGLIRVDGDMTGDERESMKRGLSLVYNMLGRDVPDVSEADVRDALWNAYWDVDVAVDELLKMRVGKSGGVMGKKKKKRGEGEKKVYLSGTCTSEDNFTKPFIPADFWNDMQWLNIPMDRQATFVGPRCPRGGLLGGTSDGAPKMSKLQALAAARKKKAQEKSSASAETVDKSMAGLTVAETSGKENETSTLDSTSSVPSRRSRTYPTAKRKNSSPHKRTSSPEEPVKEERPDLEARILPPSIEQASPSAFASTMFGRPELATFRAPSDAIFTLPYSVTSFMNNTDPFAGPSPDDVVVAAQSKAANAKTTKVAPAKTAAEKKTDQIANGVEAMRIDDTPKATSKNLDVLAEYGKKRSKNAANFVVIGHVDAGKSTLMGRLLYDLKVVDQRTIEKYRKEAEKMGKSSFALAWVLDQGTEERSRGVTIDIATNKFETEKTVFTILDAPGHRDFIPNMIAGASQADFAVLVIDASTGSFESGLKGQTKEHALLVRSMGVQRLIVAINKLDTIAWSRDRFDEISQQVSAFLTVAGFLSKNVSFVPVSGLHGDNIITRSAIPAASWYTGPTLVEELDISEPVARALDKPLRLTINDIFRGGVQNPLSISGRIEAGSLQAGDALIAAPSSQKCYIKGVEVDDETVDWAVAGQNVVLHLNGIDPAHLKIGDVLCRAGSEIKTVNEITIKILAFEFLMPMAVDVHRGRLHAAGRIREVAALLDKGSGNVTKKRPRVVKPGGLARVVVELDGLWPFEGGQRVILRDAGETVGAGIVE